MNVVRHHDIGVEFIVPEISIPIMDGVHHQACDFGPPKEERACDSVVENAVHDQKGSPGSGYGGEATIRGQAAMQAPGEEDRLADGMIMRQPATMDGSH